MISRRLATTAAAGALLLSACSDSRAPTALWDPTDPPTQEMSAADPSPHFFFLPPLAPEPTPTAPFDATASPTVTVCLFEEAECTMVVATFKMDTGSGSETIRVNPDDELFIVNWHTDDFDLAVDAFYRITVSLSGFALGSIDVRVVTNTARASKEDGGFVLKNGRTLPIKFRIEEGAGGIVIDATALSGSSFLLSGNGFFPTDEQLSLALAPGVYTLFGGGGRTHFMVTDGGVLDFPPELDLVQSGRGTTTLTIHGLPVIVDAQPMLESWLAGGALEGTVFDTFSAFGLGFFPMADPVRLTVLPMPEEAPGSIRVHGPGLTFVRVRPDGTFTYPAEFEAFLSGRGTNHLEVIGHPITIDASLLFDSWIAASPAPQFTSNQINLFVTAAFRIDAPVTLNLLPSEAGACPFRCQIVLPGGMGESEFKVLVDGTVDFPSRLDSSQNGRGTSKLTLTGLPISVDPTPLWDSWVAAGGDDLGTAFTIFSNAQYDSRKPMTVLAMPTVDIPGLTGPIRIRVGGGGEALIDLRPDGNIDYGAEADGFLSGRGTSTVSLDGHEITIDATADVGAHLRVFTLGVFSALSPIRIRMLPGSPLVQQLDVPDFAFEVLNAGVVDFVPELEGILSGRGTSTLTITPL